METLTVPAPLRARLGAEASEGLVEMFSVYHQFSTDRFERRLIEETTALRIEFRDGLAGIRVEMANMRADVIKWNLLLWVGQFAAVVAALSFMLPGH